MQKIPWQEKKKVKHLLRWKKFNPVLIYPRFFDLNLILILQKYSQGGLLKTQKILMKETTLKIYFIKGGTDHQPRLDAWDKCSGLVHWEEGWDGEGGGRKDRDGEHM